MSSMAATTPGVGDVSRVAATSNESSDWQESDAKKKSLRVGRGGEQDHQPQEEENQKPAPRSSDDGESKMKNKPLRLGRGGEQYHQPQEEEHKKPAARSSDDAESKRKFFSKAALLPGAQYIDGIVREPQAGEQSSNAPTKKASKGSSDDAESKRRSFFKPALLPGVQHISIVRVPQAAEEQSSNVNKLAQRAEPCSNVKQPPAASISGSSDDAESKRRSSSKPALLPGTQHISTVRVPQAAEEQSSNVNRLGQRVEPCSNVKQPPAASITSMHNDAKVGAAVKHISSINMTGTIINKMRDPSSSEDEEFFRSAKSMPISSSTTHTASAAIKEKEDLEAQIAGGETLQILVATRVDEELQPKLVTAVATEDDVIELCCLKVGTNRKAKRLVLGACCLVLVALIVVVGLTVAFATGGSSGGRSDTTEIPVTQESFFDTIGPIDGTVRDGNFGASVATNRDGSRIAVADLFGVHVYESLLLESPSNYEMLGSKIQGDAVNAISFAYSASDSIQSLIRAPILTTMSMDGSCVAIAWPLHSEDDDTMNIGLVEVYRYIKESLSWERDGNSLFGRVIGDLFGSSISLSEDGSSLAVGATGNGSYADVYFLNAGSWSQLGGTIALSEEVDIFSVSLSNDGRTLAVAGMLATEDAAAAKVFHWFAGKWVERGSGIDGRTAIGETIYLTDLSGDGNTIVVSNYYTTNARENTGKGLDVRAFIWSADLSDWEPLGQTMHANYTAEKSGYFVSLSEDGRKIAMGDPGARVEGQGAVSGHAHFFALKDGEWIQLGPNYAGEAAGDQFGFNVAMSGNGDYLVSGAPLNRATGVERGRVVVLKAAEPIVASG